MPVVPLRYCFSLAILPWLFVYCVGSAMSSEPPSKQDLKMIIRALQQNLIQQQDTIEELQARNRALGANSEKVRTAAEDQQVGFLKLETLIYDLEGTIRKQDVQYAEFKAEHAKRVAKVNLWAVWAVLGLSCLVVLTGAGFTGFQLYHVVTSGGPQETAILEASAQQFRLTTSFVGVVVLTLSLAFLYLFAQSFYQPFDRHKKTPALDAVVGF